MQSLDKLDHINVESKGIRLHCVVQGEGKLVVLLHGFPECWYSWRHQIPFLAKRFKVVAPDMRGYGDSDKPEDIESYGIGNLLIDVKCLIEAFGDRKAYLIGHDWGGVVAWVFAIAFPQLLEKLVVMNAPHPGIFAKDLKGNPRQILRSWYMFYFQIPRLPEATLSAWNYFAIRQAFKGWAVDKNAISTEDLDELVAAVAKPGALRSGINYYRAMMRNNNPFDMPTQFAKITSPTMLIWGEDDRALGRELTYGLAAYCEHEPLIKYIPACGHWVQQEQPLLVNHYLDEFL